MKTFSCLTAIGSFAATLLLLAGCGDSDESKRQPEPFDGFVHVTMYCDTVTFLPGDTITVPGNAVVTDRNHAAVPGVKVDISVAPPTLGVILFADSTLQDTTNQMSRVDFDFRSSGQRGDAVITASVGGVSDSSVVHLIEPMWQDSVMYMSVSPWQVWLGEGHPDSALVVVGFKDSTGCGMPNVTPILVSEGGGRVGFVPPSDSTGRTSTWWWPLCCGSRCIRASHGVLTGTACVFVDSL